MVCRDVTPAVEALLIRQVEFAGLTVLGSELGDASLSLLSLFETLASVCEVRCLGEPIVKLPESPVACFSRSTISEGVVVGGIEVR